MCRDSFPKPTAANVAMDSMLSREILRSRDLDEEAVAGFFDRKWEVGFDMYHNIHPKYISCHIPDRIVILVALSLYFDGSERHQRWLQPITDIMPQGISGLHSLTRNMEL